MLRKLHDLLGYKVESRDEDDGTVGSIEDFYFDDHTWTVRYVVVDTGSWLVGRRVLISTDVITAISSMPEVMELNLTKEQIENSPSIETEEPVSRQHEVDLQTYYGWPGYWTVSPMMGMPMMATPMGLPEAVAEQERAEDVSNGGLPESASPTDPERSLADSHLRSVREVTGYHIHATDGDIGHIQDIFADENDWIIRYMLADTRNWWPGKHVLLARDWVQKIEWDDRSITVNVTREQVKDSPEYDPRGPVGREYESALHSYYMFPGYWL